MKSSVKYNKTRALLDCAKLWYELAQTGDHLKEFAAVWEVNGGTIKPCEHDCPCCEHAYNAYGILDENDPMWHCARCPLIEGWMLYIPEKIRAFFMEDQDIPPCAYRESPYYLWLGAKTKEGRKAYAKQIFLMAKIAFEKTGVKSTWLRSVSLDKKKKK